MSVLWTKTLPRFPRREHSAAPGKTKKIPTYKIPWKRLFIKKKLQVLCKPIGFNRLAVLFDRVKLSLAWPGTSARSTGAALVRSLRSAREWRRPKKKEPSKPFEGPLFI
jgi:hypothetical protein